MMKRLALIAALMAVRALAQSYVNATSGGTTSTLSTVSAAAAVHTTGDTLVVTAAFRAACAAATMSISDTAGNTYTASPVGAYNYLSDTCTEQFYSAGITGNAANVVTLTLTTAEVRPVLSVIEIAGATVLDAHPTQGTTSGSGTITTGTFNTAAAVEVIVAGVFTYNDGNTFTAGNIGATAANIPSGATYTVATNMTSEYLVTSAIQTGIAASIATTQNIGTLLALSFKAGSAATACTLGLLGAGLC
jgi:hypothetical protein